MALDVLHSVSPFIWLAKVEEDIPGLVDAFIPSDNNAADFVGQGEIPNAFMPFIGKKI